MIVEIDTPALTRITLARITNGRGYYLANLPALGVVVDRTGRGLDALVGLSLDCSLGNEPGYQGFCHQGKIGKLHGKATLRHVVNASPTHTLSQVLNEWAKRYTE